MSKLKFNLQDQRYGRLVVLDEIERTKAGVKWKCQCDCGNIINVFGPNLRMNHTRSCGCYNKDRAKETKTKHGQATKAKGRTRTHRSWEAMLERCYNPNNKAYKNYGGRGIEVCDRWRGENGFINFWYDMKDRPKGKTLDRKNNNKSYYPKNCRWATQPEQMQNRRTRKRKDYYWDTRRQKWVSEVKINGKKKYLGSFDKEEDAKQRSLRAKN